MSFVNRGVGSRYSTTRPAARIVTAMGQERRSDRTQRVAAGSLACPHCDAPVALGAAPVRPAAPLTCPFCDHEGSVHDFLTLGEPTRPARVVVRVLSAPDRA